MGTPNLTPCKFTYHCYGCNRCNRLKNLTDPLTGGLVFSNKVPERLKAHGQVLMCCDEPIDKLTQFSFLVEK